MYEIDEADVTNDCFDDGKAQCVLVVPLGSNKASASVAPFFMCNRLRGLF
jgi:hypothetical protein